MDFSKLPLRNLLRHPGKTAGLIALVALLAFTVYAGTIMISSLQNGLSSLEARMGADLIVAPKEADSKYDLEEIILEGVPGYFYMDKAYIDKVAAREGVEKVSPQYYLSTAKASCCSIPVQIIGIDPETDFTIQPWIARSYSNTLDRGEVIMGSNISGAPGSQVMFYGDICTVVAKLDETGTSLDSAVFCNVETIKDLIQGSIDQGMSVLADHDPDEIVSTIQVKVEEGYPIVNVVNDINLHVRGVKAVQTKSMLSGVADSMGGVSSVIGIMIAVIWVLAVAVLVIVFSVSGRQRTREFAVLRVLGASRKSLSRLVITESLFVSLIGGVIGVALAALVVLAFRTALEEALGLPFLVPDVGMLAMMALAALLIALICGPVSSVFAARRLSRVEAGQILREE